MARLAISSMAPTWSPILKYEFARAHRSDEACRRDSEPHRGQQPGARRNPAHVLLQLPARIRATPRHRRKWTDIRTPGDSRTRCATSPPSRCGWVISARAASTSGGIRCSSQKQVDLLLGLDMALLASKRAGAHGLVAGDGDLYPAVQVLKGEGAIAWLVHGPRQGERRAPDVLVQSFQSPPTNRFELDEELIDPPRDVGAAIVRLRPRLRLCVARAGERQSRRRPASVQIPRAWLPPSRE